MEVGDQSGESIRAWPGREQHRHPLHQGFRRNLPRTHGGDEDWVAELPPSFSEDGARWTVWLKFGTGADHNDVQVHRPAMSSLADSGIAARLRVAAERRGISQGQLIRSMPEVAPATIGYWFTGRRQPQLDNLRRLAEILECTVASLLEDDDTRAADGLEIRMLKASRQLSPELRASFVAIIEAAAERR